MHVAQGVEVLEIGDAPRTLRPTLRWDDHIGGLEGLLAHRLGDVPRDRPAA